MSYPIVEQQLAAALGADATIQSIVGANIRGGLLQRNGPVPAVMFMRVSTVRTVASGSMTLDRGYTGFCWGRFQIDCWSDDYAQAVALAIAVRLVVTRLDLTGGGNSKANAVLQERDANGDPDQAARFCRSMDFRIWFQEEGRDG